MAKKKYIRTPAILWELFLAYGSKIKSTPILQHDFVGKEGDSVKREKERPLTLEGFYNFLDDQGIITDATDYFENKEGRYKDYIRICTRIRRTIKQDQIEGGMAGIYNPSITQRLNGLAEKQEVKVESFELTLNI